MNNPRLPAGRAYSLVVAVHNESGNLGPLMQEALAVLRTLPGDFEVLLVNDGSTDGTAAELDEIAAREPRCRILTFAENRGQAAALWHGLQSARGEIILTMDGDGQNDPRDFPALLGLLARGPADLVCGWRRHRHDDWSRRVISRLGNFIRRRLLHDGVRDAGSQLRVFRRRVIRVLTPGPMLQAFLPAQAVAAGLVVQEHPVAHRPRRHGASHYGWRNLWWQPGRELWIARRRLSPAAGRRPPPRRNG